LLTFLSFFVWIFYAQSTYAIKNGTPLTFEMVKGTPLQNVVELQFLGAQGTAYYLGNGRIVTAAHNFTMLSQTLSDISLNFKMHTLSNNSYTVSDGDADLLLDPKTETYMNTGNGSLAVQLDNDIAIVQIQSEELIKELDESGDFIKLTPSDISGDIKRGDILVSIGLHRENGPASMLELLQGRNIEEGQARFASLNSIASEVWAPKQASTPEVFKVAAIPEVGTSPQRGDSGGPVFKLGAEGSFSYAGVTHGRAKADANDISKLFAVQNFSHAMTNRFINFRSQKWQDLTRSSVMERIKKLDDSTINFLLEKMTKERQSAAQLGVPSEARKNFSTFIKKLYLDAVDDKLADEITYTFSRAVNGWYDTPDKIRDELTKVIDKRIKTLNKSCNSLMSEALNLN
jgi:hypothetical protein